MKLLCWLWLFQLPNSLPVYRMDSLVNAASQTNDRFAPNSVLTLYGVNLSYSTAKFTPPADPKPGWLYPTELGGALLQMGTVLLELFGVRP